MSQLLENNSSNMQYVLNKYVTDLKPEDTRWIYKGEFTLAFWKLFLSKKLDSDQIDSFFSELIEALDSVDVSIAGLNRLIDHKRLYAEEGGLSYQVFEFLAEQFGRIEAKSPELAYWNFTTNNVCVFLREIVEDDCQPAEALQYLVTHPGVLARLKRMTHKVEFVQYLDLWGVGKTDRLSTASQVRDFFRSLAPSPTELSGLMALFQETIIDEANYGTDSITELVNVFWRGFFYYLQTDKASFWKRQKCSWLKDFGVEKAFDDYDNITPPTKEQWEQYCNPDTSVEDVNRLTESAAFSSFSTEDLGYFTASPELFEKRWADNLQSFSSMPHPFREMTAQNLQSLGLPNNLLFATCLKQYNLVGLLDSHCAELISFEDANRARAAGLKAVFKEDIPATFRQSLPDHLLKMIEAGRPELKRSALFVKLAVVHSVFQQIFSFKEINVSAIVQKEMAEVKGWFDLSKKLPTTWKWRLYKLRKSQAKDELTLADFLATPGSPHLQAWQMMEGRAGFEDYSPFDERGGFCVATWDSLLAYAKTDTKKLELHTKEADTFAFLSVTDQNDFNPVLAAIRDTINGFTAKMLPCFRLAYLYGADWPALQKYIEQEIAARYKLKGETAAVLEDSIRSKVIHDLGQYNLPAVNASVIKAWRPFLIKHPKLLKFTGRLAKAELPVATDTYEDLAHKLLQNEYTGVPKQLTSHVIHAMENGWDQDVVDEFVELATSRKKKKVMIPNVAIKTPTWSVRCLEPHDPTALYIGELSGCCQHINEGAGNEAAIQSFTEDWCSVLVIESPSSGKLIAQSFLWLSKNKRSVVLDSVESIYDENDPIVKSHILPAIEAWAKELKSRHKLNALLSDTDYGVTNEMRNILEQGSSCRLRAVKDVEPYAPLEYSDVNDTCYRFS